MNGDLISIIIFYAFLLLVYAIFKKRFEVQEKVFVMYKTKLGLRWMDKVSRVHPKLTGFFGDVGVIIGFTGMIAMFGILIQGTYKLLFVPQSVPVVSPVLPGVSIPGLPVLSFWDWIISILIVATVHEFSHGIYARLAKVKIKSSGFAFLGPILAAFVEPDEKTLIKKKKREQLRVFAAGPFGNMILFLIVFLIAGLVVNPLVSSFVGPKMEYQGVVVESMAIGSSIAKTNISAGDKILQVDNKKTENIQNFVNASKDFKPNQTIKIVTNKGEYSVKLEAHPDNSTKGYMGVTITFEKIGFKEEALKQYGKWRLNFPIAFAKLLFWLYMISFGVGLFNLLPLGPVDGGRMFYVALSRFIKSEKKVKKIWRVVAWICILLIVINLFPYLIKLLKWIIGIF